MKKAVAVSILNQKLTVQTEADEGYVQKVAGYVEHKAREAMQKAKSASTLSVALLACMNIADELFENGRHQLSAKAVKKVQALLGLIDLHGDGDHRAL